MTTTEVLLRTHRPAHLVLSGEIDLANSDHVLIAGLSAVARAHELDDRVVLDLSRVTFMDATGLHALLELRNAAARVGRELVLRDAPPCVQRLLVIGDVDHLFLLL